MSSKSATAQVGFTLIELIVVLLIIGLTVSFVTLSVSTGGIARQTEEEARRLAALIELARQEAVLGLQELAVEFLPNGYRFLRLADEKWLPLGEDELLRQRELPAGIELVLDIDNVEVVLKADSEKATPHVFLLSSGELSPFVVNLSAPDQATVWHVTGVEDAEVNVASVGGDG